jgi:hypothetical protein
MTQHTDDMVLEQMSPSERVRYDELRLQASTAAETSQAQLNVSQVLSEQLKVVSQPPVLDHTNDRVFDWNAHRARIRDLKTQIQEAESRANEARIRAIDCGVGADEIMQRTRSRLDSLVGTQTLEKQIDRLLARLEAIEAREDFEAIDG